VGRILDLGCGDGQYLHHLSLKGWETYGVDTSPIAVERARSKGLNVFLGEVQDAGFPAGFFDVVTLRHVLEHVHSPSQTLSEVHRYLKDEGKLVLEIPILSSWDHRIARALSLCYYDIPRHLYHFTPATLGALLDKIGFVTTEARSYTLVVSAALDALRNTRAKWAGLFRFSNVFAYSALSIWAAIAVSLRISNCLQLVARKEYKSRRVCK